jgi:hypothetical protein
MGIKHVEAFKDSLLVMYHVASVLQCFDGSLNAYLDKCLEIIALFDDFTMQHVSRDEDTEANDLAQQAPGFRSNRGKFDFLEKSDVLFCQTGKSGFRPMYGAIVCSIGPSLEKLDGPVSKIGGSRIYRTSDEASEMMMVNHDDWRTPLVRYLENPGRIADRKVWR